MKPRLRNLLVALAAVTAVAASVAVPLVPYLLFSTPHQITFAIAGGCPIAEIEVFAADPPSPKPRRPL